MKKIILIGFIGILLVMCSKDIFSKNIHIYHNNTYLYLNNPTLDSSYVYYSSKSPLLIWGQYNSFNAFHFTGNVSMHIIPQPYYLHVRTLMTYQKGNVIYILPRHLNLPASGYFSTENPRSILNSGN